MPIQKVLGRSKSSRNTITIADAQVQSRNGLFSLNDLHRASGGEAKHEPSQWLRNDQTKALAAEIEAAGTKAFEAKPRIGTYACRELVIAYAAWISAAFHLKVIRVFLAVAAPTTPYSVQPGQTLSAEQANTLRDMLTSHVKRLPHAKQAGAMVKGWSKLHAHFGTDYRHIPAGEFHEAVSIIARHTAEFAEWELVDEAPKLGHQKTVNEIVADWVKKIEEPNGYPAVLFMPLVNAVLRKQGFNLALSAVPVPGLLPEAQAKEITERLDRLGKLFNPLSQPFNDVMGVLRALRGLHPVAPMPEPGYRQLLPRLA